MAPPKSNQPRLPHALSAHALASALEQCTLTATQVIPSQSQQSVFAAPLAWQIPASPSPSPSSSATLPPSTPESASSPSDSSFTSRSTSPSVSSPGSSPKLRSKKTRSSASRSVSRRTAKDPTHIPRPCNAFMLFRSIKCAEIRESGIEHDHSQISRILGKVWKESSPEVKAHFRALAAERARLHKQQHPGYRFSPQQREVPPKRRKVKRNGATDRERCWRIAELIRDGKPIEDLKTEVDKFDHDVQEKARSGLIKAPAEPSDEYTTGVFDANTWTAPALERSTSSDSESSGCDSPFRSPLFPPATPGPLPGLQIPVTASLGPVSPLGFSSGIPTYIQAPNMGVMPLPEADEDATFSQASEMPVSQMATVFGAMPLHEQGSLGLGQMWTMGGVSANNNNNGYAFQPEPYVQVHANGYSAPIDPAAQAIFSAFHPQIAGAGLDAFQPQPQMQYDSQYVLSDLAAPIAQQHVVDDAGSGWIFSSPAQVLDLQQQQMGYTYGLDGTCTPGMEGMNVGPHYAPDAAWM